MKNKYGTITAVFYIINTMLGSGINFMPAAFNMSGYAFGFGILSLVGILTGLSTYYLFRCSTKFDEEEMPLTFSNIAKKKKEWYKWLVEIMMLSVSYFSALGAQKYFTDMASVVIFDFWPNLSPTMVNNSILLSSSLCFFILGLNQNITIFKILFSASVFCISSLMVVLTILNFSLSKFISEVPRNLNPSQDYIFSFSWFVLSMHVQSNIPLLYPLLSNQDRNNTILISILGAIAGFLIYGMGGYLGYRLLGNCIGMSDLMRVFLNSNSPLNHYLNNTGGAYSKYYKFLRGLTEYQGLCAMAIILVGFPLGIAPIISFFKEKIAFKDKNSFMAQALIITPVVVSLTIINIIPNVPLTFVYEILGPSAINFISFLFPAVLYIMYAERKSMFKKVVAAMIALFSIGFFFSGVIMHSTIYSIHLKRYKDSVLQIELRILILRK